MFGSLQGGEEVDNLATEGCLQKHAAGLESEDLLLASSPGHVT